jgi:hypothetical protein
MRTIRLTPIVVAGIAILGSGCAKTSPPPGADSTLNRATNTNAPQGPMNNAVSTGDNYNARTSTTDSGAALGSTHDSIARMGPPIPKGKGRP